MSLKHVTVARFAAVAVGLLVLSGLTGCAFKASEEECKLACENVAAISNQEVNAQVEKDEEDWTLMSWGDVSHLKNLESLDDS